MGADKKINRKVDYKKELKHVFSPSSKETEVVDVPEMNFIMIDGMGDPNTSQDFKDAVEVLYGLSYTIKFMIKKDAKDPFDYGVMPLEGLWYADDISVYRDQKKDEWKWTLMIMQPERVTQAIYESAKDQLTKKKNPVAISKVYTKKLKEGKSTQIMHIGPYSEEQPAIDKLHAFVKDNDYNFNGHHHEIYLSDPSRCAPEKMKTIIRYPIKKSHKS